MPANERRSRPPLAVGDARRPSPLPGTAGAGDSTRRSRPGALERKEYAVVIKIAHVSARGERYQGVVTLTLSREPDGWTYRVDGMQDENFTLAWRARTPEGASRKLQDIYDPAVWDLAIKETI